MKINKMMMNLFMTYSRCNAKLLGDFGDYLAISREEDWRKNNLLDITDLFRSGFGFDGVNKYGR